MDRRGFIERKLNGTDYNIDFESKNFIITGDIPKQDDVYEFAMEYRLHIDEKIFDLLNKLLGVMNIDEAIEKIEEFFRIKYGKKIKVFYIEENDEMNLRNNILKIPIISKNSGKLGHLVIEGEFFFDQILGFLAFYDSFVSVIEGLILNHRLEQLLKSALNTLYLTLNKRARLTEDELFSMEKIVTELSKYAGLDIDLSMIALKTANVGLIGVRDELFEKIRSGEITDQEWEEFLKHTDYGYEILKKLDVQPELLNVSLYHHELLDSTGPKKLLGDQIPPLALIIGLAENVVLLKRDPDDFVGKYPNEYIEIVKKLLKR